MLNDNRLILYKLCVDKPAHWTRWCTVRKPKFKLRWFWLKGATFCLKTFLICCNFASYKQQNRKNFQGVSFILLKLISTRKEILYIHWNFNNILNFFVDDLPLLVSVSDVPLHSNFQFSYCFSIDETRNFVTSDSKFSSRKILLFLILIFQLIFRS